MKGVAIKLLSILRPHVLNVAGGGCLGHHQGLLCDHRKSKVNFENSGGQTRQPLCKLMSVRKYRKERIISQQAPPSRMRGTCFVRTPFG
jgi:hypothetical protein